MEIVKNIEQFDATLAAFRDGRKTFTNCYLLQDEMAKLIKQRRMFYQLNEFNLQVFVDEEAFYHMYIYLDLNEVKNRKLQIAKLDKPTLFEFLYREGKMKETESEVVELLLESGFVLHASNYEYVFDLNHREVSNKKNNVQFASLNELSSIFDLWHENLDDFVFPYISEKEWEDIVSQKRLICTTYSDKRICGAQQFDIIGKRSIEHHIVIDKAARGRGIGKTLLESWLSCVKDRGCDKAMCWIATDNVSSIRMHEACGARKTGKCSIQFVNSEYKSEKEKQNG